VGGRGQCIGSWGRGDVNAVKTLKCEKEGGA